LIAIPFEENGELFVIYFTDAAEARAAMAKRRPGDGRHLAGAWKDIDKDLDWDTLADELDRIRHESTPTPPIDLDELDLRQVTCLTPLPCPHT
jgi:hypothetical protein